MLKGLTRAGIGNVGDDKQFILAASANGFQAVDLDAKELIDNYGLESAKDLLKENNLVIGAIGLPVEWRQSEELFRADIVNLASRVEAAVQLGCNKCVTYMLPSTDQKSARFMSVVVKRLRLCAEILDAYGMRLGLEFVGPVHLRTAWKNPFIWTLDETLDLIDAIGLKNVGLLLDSYHWYTTGLSKEDLAQLTANQIVHVHINDAYDIPIDELRDNDRLYPGEGVIDLEGFLEGIKRTGYDGVVAQEVLTPNEGNTNADELLQRSKRGFDKLWG